MKFTTNPKEHTMKTALTSSYVKLPALIAVAASVVAVAGSFKGW